jgi:hypothetical protein
MYLHNDIKWGLDKIQGVEFDDKYELARNIRSKVSRNKGRGRIFGSTSKTVEETTTHSAPTTTIKSNISKQFQRINLKIIIIPIIALAIIGLIVAVSYFNGPSPSSPSINTPNSSNNSLINVNTLDQYELQLIDTISFTISEFHDIEKDQVTQVLIDRTKATKASGGDVMKNLREIAMTITKNPNNTVSDNIIELAKTYPSNISVDSSAGNVY